MKIFIKKQNSLRQNNLNNKLNKVLNNYYNVLAQSLMHFLIIVLFLISDNLLKMLMKLKIDNNSLMIISIWLKLTYSHKFIINFINIIMLLPIFST